MSTMTTLPSGPAPAALWSPRQGKKRRSLPARSLPAPLVRRTVFPGHLPFHSHRVWRVVLSPERQADPPRLLQAKIGRTSGFFLAASRASNAVSRAAKAAGLIPQRAVENPPLPRPVTVRSDRLPNELTTLLKHFGRRSSGVPGFCGSSSVSTQVSGFTRGTRVTRQK